MLTSGNRHPVLITAAAVFHAVAVSLLAHSPADDELLRAMIKSCFVSHYVPRSLRGIQPVVGTQEICAPL